MNHALNHAKEPWILQAEDFGTRIGREVAESVKKEMVRTCPTAMQGS